MNIYTNRFSLHQLYSQNHQSRRPTRQSTNAAEIQFVQCQKFHPNDEPFKVKISLSALMCLQLHSLSTDKEVTGLIGGKRYYKEGKLWLYLLRYKPCKPEQEQSKMCCEIPINSRVKESSRLRAEGFELLGWFHSHPRYPRKPSTVDVKTQKDLQLSSNLGPDRPMVGLIFSCLDMKMRCIYINSKDLKEDELVKPYDLEVAITKEHKHFPIHVENVLSAIKDDDTDIKKVVSKEINKDIFDDFNINPNFVINFIRT